MDKLKQRMAYSAPVVERLEARVERGFTMSQFNVEENPDEIKDYNLAGDITGLFT